MAKVLIRDVYTIEVLRRFEAVHYTGDDGYPAAKLMDVVAIKLYDAESRQDRQFFIPNSKMVEHPEDGFRFPVQRYRPGVLIQKILDAGVVDTDNWIEVEEKTSEELAEEAWQEELRDRNDHGDFRYGYAH